MSTRVKRVKVTLTEDDEPWLDRPYVPMQHGGRTDEEFEIEVRHLRSFGYAETAIAHMLSMRWTSYCRRIDRTPGLRRDPYIDEKIDAAIDEWAALHVPFTMADLPYYFEDGLRVGGRLTMAQNRGLIQRTGITQAPFGNSSHVAEWIGVIEP